MIARKLGILFLQDLPHYEQAYSDAIIAAGHHLISVEPDLNADSSEPAYLVDQIEMSSVSLIIHLNSSENTWAELCSHIRERWPHLPFIHVHNGNLSTYRKHSRRGPLSKIMGPYMDSKSFLRRVRRLTSESRMRYELDQAKLNILFFARLHQELNLTDAQTVVEKLLVHMGETFKAENVIWLSQRILNRILGKKQDRSQMEAEIEVQNLELVYPPVIPEIMSFRHVSIKTVFRQIRNLRPHLPLSILVKARMWQWNGLSIISVINSTNSNLLGHFLVMHPKIEINATAILSLQNYAAQSLHYSTSLAKVQHLIHVDDLTNLFNQRYLSEALDKEIHRSVREQTPFSVLFLDIDHFKLVNDNHGHLVGSRLLSEIASVLSDTIRKIDYAFRYGGDEFVILLVGADTDSARVVAERMRTRIAQKEFKVFGKVHRLTVSIGIATFPTHAQKRDELLSMADQAMYYGKNKSRNIVYIAS